MKFTAWFSRHICESERDRDINVKMKWLWLCGQATRQHHPQSHVVIRSPSLSENDTFLATCMNVAVTHHLHRAGTSGNYCEMNKVKIFLLKLKNQTQQ